MSNKKERKILGKKKQHKVRRLFVAAYKKHSSIRRNTSEALKDVLMELLLFEISRSKDALGSSSQFINSLRLNKFINFFQLF